MVSEDAKRKAQYAELLIRQYMFLSRPIMTALSKDFQKRSVHHQFHISLAGGRGSALVLRGQEVHHLGENVGIFV